jgi:hypothetical protein
MTTKHLVLRAAVSAACIGTVIAALSIKAPRVQAQDSIGVLSAIGLTISPVTPNLAGRDPVLVGYGSYLVNAIGDCNGCHTSGGPPNLNYAAGGNPYFGQPTKVDPTVYLSGGADFGPVGTPTGPAGYPGPDIIARNLTPDKKGLAEGGNTLAQFKQILRMGTDFDNVHPTCTADQLAVINAGVPPFPTCIPTSPGNTPNGALLQVMPWPTFSNMSDFDIAAIYAYLSAIPCINNTTLPGPAGDPTELQNDCGTPSTPPATPVAVFTPAPASGPAPLTVTFDGTASTGGNLTYGWNFGDHSVGFGSVVMHTFTAAGTYAVTLTVTNSAGSSHTEHQIVVTAGGGAGGGNAPSVIRRR